MILDDSNNGMITGARLYGLEESIVASGFPMCTDYDSTEFFKDSEHVWDVVNIDKELSEDAVKHVNRACSLGKCDTGKGHDCWMCGAVVQFNLTAPRYFWHEWQRYHFQDIVSSTSTMHRLKSIVKKYDMEQLKKHFDSRVPDKVVELFMELSKGILESDKDESEKKRLLKVILPEGYLQTARVSTNYRQLKTMVHQRVTHELLEWQEFVVWCRGLPLADELLFGDR